MRPRNNLKINIIFAFIITSFPLISWQYSLAGNYTAFQVNTYQTGVNAYNNGDYASALYQLGMFYGSVATTTNNYTQMSNNVRHKLSEVNDIINYCMQTLKSAVDTKSIMQRFGNNFTVTSTISTGGKQSGASSYQTLQEQVSLPNYYLNKPGISYQLY